MLAGTVDQFITEFRKYFGFIVGDNGNRVFFHINGYTNVEAGLNRPEFTKVQSLTTFPRVGDRVVYQPQQTEKGVKAVKWGWEQSYYTALQVIESRPIYRIVKQFRAVGVNSTWTEPNVVWQGSNLFDPVLSQRYHPKLDQSGKNNVMEWRTLWQTTNDKGETWVDCACPSIYLRQFNDSTGRRTFDLHRIR